MSDSVKEEAIGVIDGVNVDFNTSTAYFPGTLFAYKNGILVEQDGDDGPIEMGGTDVRMREAYRDGDTLHFWYLTGPPTPGAFAPPPRMLAALELSPETTGALHLRPRMVSSTDESDTEELPDMLTSDELAPKVTGALNLRPKMISAEEQ